MSNSTDITICEDLDALATEIAPLYHIYSCESHAQRAYISLSENGNVHCDYDDSTSGAVPPEVWNNRTLRWYINSQVRGNVLAQTLRDTRVLGLLQRVYNGHWVHWDGNNHVGELDADADAAFDALQDLLDSLIDDDALAYVYDADAVVTAETFATDWPAGASLAEAIENVERDGRAGQYGIIGDIKSALLWIAEQRHDKSQPLTTQQIAALRDAGIIDDDDDEDAA